MKEPSLTELRSVSDAGLRLLPPGFSVQFVPSTAEKPFCGALLKDFRTTASAIERTGNLLVPFPETRECLFIVLHEVGHAVLGHVFEDPGLESPSSLVQKEKAATLFALSFMAQGGIPATDSIKRVSNFFAEDSGFEVWRRKWTERLFGPQQAAF